MQCDYTRPSTWKPYRSGLCQDCHADCCRLPVEVHLNELTAMGLATEDEIIHEPMKVIRQLKREHIIRLFNPKRKMCTLNQRPDGSCLYLGTNRLCSIYERRPETCREFPEVGPRPKFCPHNK